MRGNASSGGNSGVSAESSSAPSVPLEKKPLEFGSWNRVERKKNPLMLLM